MPFNGAFIDSNGQDIGVPATLDGTGGLTKLGGGTLTLTAVNSYSGGTTIAGGKLIVGADFNLGAASGGLTLDGGTLDLDAVGAAGGSHDITFGTSVGAARTLGVETTAFTTGDLVNQIEAGDFDLFHFDRTWARSERWGQVVLAPGELPRGLDEAEVLEAIASFERVEPGPALPAYEAASARFPESAPAWLGLGNARYRARELEGVGGRSVARP